jgi:putative endonuclease
MDSNGLESRAHGHFGSAPFFAVVDTVTGEIDVAPNAGQRHRHGECNPASHVNTLKVEAVVCHGMGKRALASFRRENVDVLIASAIVHAHNRVETMSQSYFWIYMLECENGSYYTGYSTNLVRRFRQHVEGTANVRYTRSHRPIRIAQCWRLYEPVGCALKVERLIKTRGRTTKDKLVNEPSRLKSMAAAKLGTDVRIFAFNPCDVESASRALPLEDLRDTPDPFASIPPGNRKKKR